MASRMSDPPLRRGWTTGTCAAAAAKAAYSALLTGEFPDPVEVILPKGQRPSFALALTRRDEQSSTAAIVKDAGDVAWRTAARVLEGADIALEVTVFDRDGKLFGRAPPVAHGASSARKR
jgi:cobalamin biosynthesis protein CbiD